jgi:uncharacterized protein
MVIFSPDIKTIGQLVPGMKLTGIVTNVTNFGAFVDIGVHQDGLVHVSELADRFVKDPREVVKAGDVVRVRVKDVNVDRKRIALTMKSGGIDTRATGNTTSASRSGPPQSGGRGSERRGASPKQCGKDTGESALAAALRRAREQARDDRGHA